MSAAVPSNVLYVGNLPKGTSKVTLENYLQPYGVMRINVREGYGIAEMNSVAEAQRAIQLLNGQDFNGSSIAVRFKTQPQHKQANQFRQVNNNHNQNNLSNGKDVNGKGFSPLSPPNVISHPQQDQVPPPQQIYQDLSSPQSAGQQHQQQAQQQMQSAEVRTVQVGLRGLQITTTNNLAQHQQKQQMQLEQELKNVAFLPDSEKVRQLEQIVHLQQNKINKLEARLEEIMEAASKQMQQAAGHQMGNRPNVLMPPQGSLPLQMQHHQAPPQISQQPPPQLGNHFTSPHHQFSIQQQQQPQFYGPPQQLAGQHWGQSPAAYPPPTSQFYGGGPAEQVQQHQQPNYGNVPPPLMLHPQSKFEPGTFMAPGYAPNIPLTPVEAMNNCFFAPPPNGGQVPGMPGGDAFHHNQHPHHPIQVNQHHRNDFNHRNGDNGGTGPGGNNRFSNGGQIGGNRQNIGNSFKGQNVGNNNRPLRGGNNRQQGGYQRLNSKNSVENKKPTPANTTPAPASGGVSSTSPSSSVSPNENKAPAVVEQQNSVVEAGVVKVVESVCQRCQKAIPENASKCPDCRNSSSKDDTALGGSGDEERDEKTASLEKSPEVVTCEESQK